MNKNELIGSVVLLGMLISACFCILKIKGRNALITLIRRAEYIFDFKGAGKEKLKFVLEEASKVVPIPFKWFLNISLIERLVTSLQAEFEEDKELKKTLK